MRPEAVLVGLRQWTGQHVCLSLRASRHHHSGATRRELGGRCRLVPASSRRYHGKKGSPAVDVYARAFVLDALYPYPERAADTAVPHQQRSRDRRSFAVFHYHKHWAATRVQPVAAFAPKIESSEIAFIIRANTQPSDEVCLVSNGKGVNQQQAEV